MSLKKQIELMFVISINYPCHLIFILGGRQYSLLDQGMLFHFLISFLRQALIIRLPCCDRAQGLGLSTVVGCAGVLRKTEGPRTHIPPPIQCALSALYVPQAAGAGKPDGGRLREHLG